MSTTLMQAPAGLTGMVYFRDGTTGTINASGQIAVPVTAATLQCVGMGTIS